MNLDHQAWFTVLVVAQVTGAILSFSAPRLSVSYALNTQTLRQWMIADGLWFPHSQRKPRIYQPRYHRDCVGELIQIDGSQHDWFEGRSDKCCMMRLAA